MATETTERECEDGWEDARLEEEHDHEHSNTAPVAVGSIASVGADSRSEENHDEGLVGKQDVAWLGHVHETSSRETTNCEETLSDGVEVGTLAMSLVDREIWVGLLEVVDEEGGDGDLSTDVAELGGNTEEESVLLAHWLVNVAGGTSGHLSLISHIGIGDLRKRHKVEDDGEDGDESRDAEVDVLDGRQILAIGTDVLEDDKGGKDGCDNGAHSLEGLRQLETELRPLWRTADGNVWVGCCLEGGKTRADNEHAAAEAAE